MICDCSKHGFIDNCLREVLAERGIEYVPPGFERVPKKKEPEVTEIVQEFTDGAEGQDGLDDETIVFVALDDNQAQVRHLVPFAIFSLLPVANAMKVLLACICKSVNTGLFLITEVA